MYVVVVVCDKLTAECIPSKSQRNNLSRPQQK